MARHETVLLISASDAGHRASYATLFSGFFSTRVATAPWAALATGAPVLFLMIEEHFAGYAIVAAIRALFGRRTVGLMFRPGPALEGGDLRTRLKQWILRVLRHMPNVSTLTIVPFDVAPGFARIADDYIHDPQLWDLSANECALVAELADGSRKVPEAALVADLRSAAGSRRVVGAVGRQDRDKGFDLFARTFAASDAIREVALFAYAGKVGARERDDADALAAAGGYAINRFVSDGELLAMYAASDFIWCVYAPDYDQASGIFGRAVQLGRVPIIREGSMIHRQCISDGLAHIALRDETPAEELARRFTDWQTATSLAPTAEWRRRAIAVITDALGIEI